MLERMGPRLERLLKAVGVEDGPPLAHPSPAPERHRRSLAQDVLVAILDPKTGKFWNLAGAGFVVRGALMVELAHEGRLEVTGTDDDACGTVIDPRPLGDPGLDSALLRIRDLDGKRVTKQVAYTPGIPDVVKPLVAAGEFVEEDRNRLGLFPSYRLRPTSSERRDDVVAPVRSALLGESIPDDWTALLIATLRIGAPIKLFVPRQHAKEAMRRVAESCERLGEAERATLSAVEWARIKADSSSSDAGGFG